MRRKKPRTDLPPVEPDDNPGNHFLYNTTGFDVECGRIASLEALGKLDTEPEKAFEDVSMLMKDLFKTPASFIALTDPTRCWFKAAHGDWSILAKTDETGRTWYECARTDGWCDYMNVPTTPEVMVIEDSHKDARFASNVFVVGPPYLRFYAGAPLVGSKGERYGTLCVMDVVPRAFSAEMYAMLSNFAHLVSEELERDVKIREMLKEDLMNDVERSRHLDLSLQAAMEGTLVLDLRESSWPIVYANPAFPISAGLSEAAPLVGHNFWDMFDCKSHSTTELGMITGLGDSFEMQLQCKETGCDLFLRFLPATSDRLAPSKAAAIPSWAPSDCSSSISSGSTARTHFTMHSDIQINAADTIDPAKSYWFAVVCDGEHSLLMASAAGKPQDSESTKPRSTEPGVKLEHWSRTQSGGSTASTKWPTASSEISLEGFGTGYGEYHLPPKLGVDRLGPLLGSGSFGKVYRAITPSKQTVAVKVVDCRKRLFTKDRIDAQLREVQLCATMQHPNVVRILSYATSTDLTAGRPVDIVWMSQEFCDLGTLSRSTEQGWLRKERSLTAPVNMEVLMNTLLDIAEGMAFVHSRSIIHADLNGRNVLLSSTPDREWGFVAKVSDFGMSRYTLGAGLETKAFGTVTHMPPELLENLVLLPVADVWSFGVIGWESYHGKCSYQGKNAAQVVVSIVWNRPLLWPADTPDSFLNMMQQCLSFESDQRPSFQALLPQLRELAGVRQGQQHRE